MTPSTYSEDLLALQESERKHEIPVDIQSNTAFFSSYGGSLMIDNHIGDPTECINASHFSDQNYANPNDLMNPHSTSMPNPAPVPYLNHLSTSIHFANDTENSPSNNNYANDDNELNNDQLNFGNSSDLQNYDYYEAHDPNPATSSDS